MAFLASLGGGELVSIFIVVLILFGPRRLPEIARTLGRWYARLQAAMADFQRHLMAELPSLDDSEAQEDNRDSDSLPPPPSPPPPAG